MKMTVYFDGNFWLGLIEYDDDGDYKVFRYFFGKEPKDDDVFNFINHKLNDLIKKYFDENSYEYKKRTSIKSEM